MISRSYWENVYLKERKEIKKKKIVVPLRASYRTLEYNISLITGVPRRIAEKKGSKVRLKDDNIE